MSLLQVESAGVSCGGDGAAASLPGTLVLGNTGRRTSFIKNQIGCEELHVFMV